MNRFSALLSLLCLPGGDDPSLPPAPASRADAPQRFQFSLYRARGDISGETSLTVDIRANDREQIQAASGSSVFFTKANLTVGGVKLVAGDAGWTWDGKDRPPPGCKVEEVSRPMLATAWGCPFEIFVGQDTIQYFERRSDGLFELKENKERTGFSISGTVEGPQGSRIILRDLAFRVDAIERRTPIEGVQLDVGRPLVSRKEHKATLAVEPGRDYGVLFTSEGFGSLILRISVLPR